MIYKIIDLKISLFKIGIILSVIGIIWTSGIFLESNKISEEFTVESQHSHKIQLNFEGNGVGYYKIFMPEFLKYKIFVQVLDDNENIISEKNIETKMSVSYFDFDQSGKYTINVVNTLEHPIDIQIELGNTAMEEMIYSGIMIFAGGIIIVISSFIKLRNYKIEHPDENIT
jgi:hypothetical protein